MVKLKVRKVGNSLGLVLPQEALTRLRVREGDELLLTDSSEGMHLTPHDPDFARKMAIAEKLCRKYRDTIVELAK
ncbi:MAG: AbrB/MazE/SpoVT family DNA-binding domain-containing protein [Tepidisphaerales bacterium]